MLLLCVGEEKASTSMTPGHRVAEWMVGPALTFGLVLLSWDILEEGAHPFMGALGMAHPCPAPCLILKMEAQRYKLTSVQSHTAKQSQSSSWWMEPSELFRCPLEPNQGAVVAKCLPDNSCRVPDFSVNPWVLGGGEKNGPWKESFQHSFMQVVSFWKEGK